MKVVERPCLEQAGMFVFFGVLELPEDPERNMDTPSAELEYRLDVGLEGVADHQELVWSDAQLVAEDKIFLL